MITNRDAESITERMMDVGLTVSNINYFQVIKM